MTSALSNMTLFVLYSIINCIQFRFLKGENHEHDPLIRQAPLIHYICVLSYLLSWCRRLLQTAGSYVWSALAAVIVLAITIGKPGLGNLWRRIQIGVLLVLVRNCPGLVASYIGGAYLINLHLGASVISSPQLHRWLHYCSSCSLGGCGRAAGAVTRYQHCRNAFPGPKRRIDGHPRHRCCSSHLAFAAVIYGISPGTMPVLYLRISNHDFLAFQWKRWQRFGCDGIPFRLQR